jgi:hypothetical protein
MLIDTVVLMATTNSFPLRLRSARLRLLVRELAEREHISQNEFIELALEHEVVVRGVLVTEELAAAAKRLGELTNEHYAMTVSRSVDSFVAGEAGRDPLQATALQIDAGSTPVRRFDSLGVLEAFESGRR